MPSAFVQVHFNYCDRQWTSIIMVAKFNILLLVMLTMLSCFAAMGKISRTILTKVKPVKT